MGKRKSFIKVDAYSIPTKKVVLEIRVFVRLVVAWMVAPVLALTGYRFSRALRHGDTKWHRLIYKMCNTVASNKIAGLLFSFIKYKERV